MLVMRAWRTWTAVARYIGDFQARVLLTLAYFTLLLPISVVVTALSDPLRIRANARPQWWDRSREQPTLETVRRQA